MLERHPQIWVVKPITFLNDILERMNVCVHMGHAPSLWRFYPAPIITMKPEYFVMRLQYFIVIFAWKTIFIFWDILNTV